MDDHSDDREEGSPGADERLVSELDPWGMPWPEPPPVEAGWRDEPPPPGEAPPLVYSADLIGDSGRPRRRWPIFAGAFAAAFGGALVAVGILAVFGLLDSAPAETSEPPVTVIERVRTELVPQAAAIDTAEAVAIKVVPSIVTVTVGTLVDGECQPFASGSGVVLDAQGRIATNHHVVDGSECQRVIFQDGATYDARLLGSDELTDLAVLDIDATALVPIEIGVAEDLAIGETTIAVGNPLGQVGGASLTAGVLSAINREVDFGDGSLLFGMLQTDAPITQGSSGGALVDAEGKLIGITSAIGVSEAGAEGIGYAIPVELVTRITQEIVEMGAVKHAFLGIEGSDHVTSREDGATVPAGAEIAEVLAATSASALGLEVGDVIVGLDGDQVRTMNDLVIKLRLYRVGDEVTFRVEHDGDEFTRSVVLGERPLDADG